MFLMRFTERAYVNYTREDVLNSPNEAVRLTFSNSHFDPQIGSELYNTHLDEYEYSEEMGFDGLMLNEHHNTPTCLGATMKPGGRHPRPDHQEAQDRAAGQSPAHLRQPHPLGRGTGRDRHDLPRPVGLRVRSGNGCRESGHQYQSSVSTGSGSKRPTTCLSRPGPRPAPSDGRASTTSSGWSTPLRRRFRNRTRPSGFPAPAARKPLSGAPSATTPTSSWKLTTKAPRT